MKKLIISKTTPLSKTVVIQSLSELLITHSTIFRARFFLYPGLICILVNFASCEKENTKTKPDAEYLTTEQITVCVEGANTISTEVQSFMTNAMLVAADSGYYSENPPAVSRASGISFGNLKSTFTSLDNGWTGPDKNGWYTWSYSGLYEYSQKVRKTNDTIDYIYSIKYSGGDGSYSNITTTRYLRHVDNDSVLYDGYSIWDVEAFGDNEISSTEWKIEFTDWNPNSSAGNYDWYWGVSENSGGNTVPLHRYESLTATETQPDGWLHCHVICYDDEGAETWNFEYDTPCVPVVMPEIPATNN